MQAATNNLSVQSLAGLAASTYLTNADLAIGTNSGGFVLWASVSDEVAERLASGTSKLRPQDWKSGDKLWVVEVIARPSAARKRW